MPHAQPVLLPGLDPAALQHAADLLRAGRLVAFPTETVYGLGADGLNPDAVAGIYAAKGRPSNNPLILHVPDVEAAKALVSQWPSEAQALAEAFWPGPLTLVLPAADHIPAIVRAGNPTVALRCPEHPVALALLKAVGRPLAAPSANRSMEVSPTLAQHVAKSLGTRVDLILDGGPTRAGLESTIVDLSRRPFRLLRPGPLAPEGLEAILGPLERFTGHVAEGAQQAAPGLAARHYSPHTALRLAPRSELATLAAAQAGPVAVVTFGAPPDLPSGVRSVEIPADADAAGTALYALLHDLDAAGLALILWETPPEGDAWLAVKDRLGRAAAQA